MTPLVRARVACPSFPHERPPYVFMGCTSYEAQGSAALLLCAALPPVRIGKVEQGAPLAGLPAWTTSKASGVTGGQCVAEILVKGMEIRASL